MPMNEARMRNARLPEPSGGCGRVNKKTAAMRWIEHHNGVVVIEVMV